MYSYPKQSLLVNRGILDVAVHSAIHSQMAGLAVSGVGCVFVYYKHSFKETKCQCLSVWYRQAEEQYGMQ